MYRFSTFAKAKASFTKTILNVAEKPSATREITKILSENTAKSFSSPSKYNPNYEFNYNIMGEDVIMKFTSVTGHIMRYEFEEKYSKKYWNTCPYEHLFKSKLDYYYPNLKVAKVNKILDPEKNNLSKNLSTLAKSADSIILWLDCDREGEAIAYEVLDICQKANPKLEVYRAQFSAFTEKDIKKAVENLRQPDPNLSAAVESRQEIDLRIGAAFTRFQTTLLQKSFPELASKLISYGPCQFPTLGFVVERYKKVKNFVPEPYWYISVKYERLNQETKEKEMVEFDWDKKHLFEKQKAEELYEKCMTNPEAKVILVKEQEKFKTRPLPLSTVSLQKIATSKLGLPSHKVMEAADKLYNKGFISYPRTETDLFVNTINLTGLLRTHKDHPEWGPYVNKLLEGGKFKWPRDGGHNDNAHPPIHPVKMVIKEQASNFTPEEWKVYELITRHFLACCSQDAVGSETQIKIDIQGETFTAKGLVVKERNWLEVYPYEKWSNSTVPKFAADEIFKPTDISLKESKTSPPHLLTENELISLMDKNGIGTDATIHEHIKTIQERAYALKTGNHFQPTKLGEALVTAYENMGIDLWKPTLRASMEASMTQIAKGLMKKETFLEECLTQMEKIFAEVKQKQHLMIEALKQYYTFGGDRRVGSRTHLDLPDLNDINRSDQKEGSSTTTTSQQAQDKTPVQAKSASSKSKSAQEKTNNVLSTEEEGSEETAKPKKRGRPKKNTTVVAEKNDSKSLENAIQADENGTPQKKKRTRRTKTSEEDNSLKVEEQSAAEVKKGEEKVSKVDQSKEKIWNYKKLLEDELDSIGNNVKKSAMSQKTRSKSAEKSKKSDSSVLDEIPENKSKIFVRKRNLILQKAK